MGVKEMFVSESNDDVEEVSSATPAITQLSRSGLIEDKDLRLLLLLLLLLICEHE